jgi:hypothetical protein
MKHYLLFLLLFFSYSVSYSQKEIIKNGQKINKLDKKNKKQGSWFFFNKIGDLEVSCYYKNDSIVTPVVYYKNNDSIFVRYQKVEKSEVFLLKTSGNWIVGNIDTTRADSTKIEILGRYIKIRKDTFDIKDDESLTNSLTVKKEAEYWVNKEIQPIYMFGTEALKDFYYRTFSSSRIVFNKSIIIEISLNESGIIENVAFPGKFNNLNIDELSELSYLFSRMERWQPFFSRNKTSKYIVHLNTGTTLRY